MKVSGLWVKFIDWIVTEGLRLVVALFVLFIVFKVINLISRKLEKRLKKSKKHVDETISRVTISVSRKTFKFLAFVCFLGYVGIETTSIAAAITSAGLAVGLALQGSLSNFAGGVIVLVMRPYKLGDYIECNGTSGTVNDIKLFYTYITTIDNKEIVLPNGKMADSSIINYSKNKLRRLDLYFEISYKNDVEAAKKAILTSIVNSNNYKEVPSPFVSIDSCKNNIINLVLKVWCDNEEYWNLYYYLQEEVKRQFEVNGITIPYNEVDINLKAEN